MIEVLFFLRDATEYMPSSHHQRAKTDPILEALHFLVFRIPDDEQCPKTL
jgi:hypothetical protein